MEIPHHIPSQLEIIRRAKAGDQEAIAAINSLAETSWMRAALADPTWGKR